MMNKSIIIAALTIIIFVVTAYFLNFYYTLDYRISDDTGVWGQLGDYFGGTLNPILSFISIVLLIRSLNFQNSANESLKQELRNSEKTEKIRTFEMLFFNIISSQRDLFESFRVQVSSGENTVIQYKVEAVLLIEDHIQLMRSEGKNDAAISEYLSSVDAHDEIFGIARAFYVAVRLISEKLSDDNGFELKDRESYFRTLVNFTDFSQLRLIVIVIQFMNYQSSNYLKSHNEFRVIIEELGLQFQLY